ncbi:glycosyltransferase [Beijerinckia indica]|uniref:Glycosyl transferase family 28 n=1 Tax=Beijerinckia indica subsp. indica (strain ATCC 9039 / DSM 1715 / NCIMB 8712) TaxID=395963 RepID=B2IDJ2_BEII9|nr:glycosyltransferase [Beijerinckia indica]ACB95428.1 glycosyl transferase family 28 [Beijerinckia indica subsp. indica ATCC 9039]
MKNAKKIVLATFGTLGDIYPFIAIALAMKARGFAPVIAAPEMHKRAIEGENIAFVLMRPHEDDIIRALGVDIPGAFKIMLKNPYFILDEIYMRFLSETYDDVMRAAAGAHIIITHSLLVGAHQAAEKLGLPCARVALAPLHLQSAAAPSFTPSAPYILEPKSRAIVHYNRIVRAIIRLSINMRMGRLRAFRKKIGLPPTHEDFFLDFGKANKAQAFFGLFSPHFAPVQPDHPQNISTPGFPFYKPADADRRDLGPGLQAFLSAGEPPIIFTLGSFAPEVSGDFYDQSLRAARLLGRRAILLAGAKDATRLASRVGPHEYVCEQAPHSLLFPKGLCIVHHGGIGTTAEALRAGKPQIVVPFFGDQPDHGARIEKLGLGLAIKLSAYDERRAAAALQRIIAKDYFQKAKSFVELIEAEKGVETIADWAESLF